MRNCGAWACGTMFIRKIHIVEEGRVYRTGVLPLETFEKKVAELGILTFLRVICLHRGNREYFDKIEQICGKRGIIAFHISLKHNQVPDKKSLAMILDVFDHARYPQLIMCWRGADRSGLASALYKMRIKRPRNEVMAQLSLFPYGHLWFLHPRYHFFLKKLYDQFGGDLEKYMRSDADFSLDKA